MDEYNPSQTVGEIGLGKFSLREREISRRNVVHIQHVVLSCDGVTRPGCVSPVFITNNSRRSLRVSPLLQGLLSQRVRVRWLHVVQVGDPWHGDFKDEDSEQGRRQRC